MERTNITKIGASGIPPEIKAGIPPAMRFGENIFRLKEHTERLFESAKIINVPINHSIDEVIEAQIGVISKSKLKDAYIRPLLYLNDERLGLDIVGMKSHLMISCWEWPTYFGAEAIEQGIDVMISSFTRQFPNSLMTKAKILEQH